ncbi:RNA polymerase sigma-70 factor (ECF subfamily) [Nocardioides thalensis]|uniref:RNA polymerase sigma factor n=1 Tax=Nocardioides thalensis TaxID=1914755 RepID=A0A853C214_9ACTN|nr:ECF RNA polymerase sigma factor SigK [Nocardioides thalensis]NYJ02240.1 RNA polymerase sigma-70 factor (ECF subfamily) [Nocardioides thalensis]
MNPGPETTAGASPEGAPAGGAALVELLHRSARGDRDAYAALYDLTAGRVHGVAVRVVRDPAQAEEVTQEVYLEAWRTASRYDAERGTVTTWLLTITHRKAVDRVRSAEASRRREATFHHRNHSVEHDTTAEAVQATFEARRVRAALTQLTDVQREAIELAYFGGYTHTEVAAFLDLPVGTAKTRIRDGLIRLRDTIGAGR